MKLKKLFIILLMVILILPTLGCKTVDPPTPLDKVHYTTLAEAGYSKFLKRFYRPSEIIDYIERNGAQTDEYFSFINLETGDGIKTRYEMRQDINQEEMLASYISVFTGNRPFTTFYCRLYSSQTTSPSTNLTVKRYLTDQEKVYRHGFEAERKAVYVYSESELVAKFFFYTFDPRYDFDYAEYLLRNNLCWVKAIEMQPNGVETFSCDEINNIIENLGDSSLGEPTNVYKSRDAILQDGELFKKTYLLDGKMDDFYYQVFKNYDEAIFYKWCFLPTGGSYYYFSYGLVNEITPLRFEYLICDKPICSEYHYAIFVYQNDDIVAKYFYESKKNIDYNEAYGYLVEDLFFTRDIDEKIFDFIR